jgi:hypothetical protein
MWQVLFKSALTLFLMWTLLNFYIGVVIDPDDAPKWMVWSMTLWLGAICGSTVLGLLYLIWSV